MKTNCLALIVPGRLTEPVRTAAVEPSLENLQVLVEGNVEAITYANWHAYINDDGRGLPENIRAEVLIREAGLQIGEAFSGTAVFLGHQCHRGEADVPGRLIALAEHLFTNSLAGVCLQKR